MEKNFRDQIGFCIISKFTNSINKKAGAKNPGFSICPFFYVLQLP